MLPPAVTARVSVEQASTLGWSRYVGTHGESIGMHTFGASAPLKELQKKFGFTPDRVRRGGRAADAASHAARRNPAVTNGSGHLSGRAIS